MAGAGCAKHRGQRPLSLVVCGCAVTPATLAPFPLAVDHTESVLAVKGSLRRFAPWTAPGRSERRALFNEGKGGVPSWGEANSSA